MVKHLPSLVVAAVLGISAAVADPLPFEGTWAKNPEACGSGKPDDGARITITANRLVASPFMTCDFTSVLPGGISYRIEASCDANGQKGAEFFTFAVMSERLYWSWAEKTATFERCLN